MLTPKSFEYHQFLRNILHADTVHGRPYIVADEQQFRAGVPNYPYRNYFYGIGLVCEGKRQVQVGFETFDLQAQTLLIIGPGLLRQWKAPMDTMRHRAFFFTADLFQPPITSDFLQELSFFKANTQHAIPLQQSEFQEFQFLFDGLLQFETQPAVIRGLAYALLEKTSALYEKIPENTSKSTVNRKWALTRQFQDLVQKHYLEYKNLGFYADKMHLSAKHLSETVKETTGKPAKFWIETLVLFEAKSLLKQTDMSIKEIVYWLGYDDPSYFNRLFREAEGLTPLAYRNSNP